MDQRCTNAEKNAIFKSSYNRYFVAVYNVARHKTIFLGNYDDYKAAQKELYRYMMENGDKIPKRYCTY